MKKTFLLFLLAFSFFAAADSIPGEVYPDPGCSAAAGTVLDSAKPGEIAIADILLKNDQPFLYVPENLCTAAKVFLVLTDAKAKALATQQGKANPEDLEFDVELHFRDVSKGFAGIPLKLTKVKLHKLDAKSPFKTLGQGANKKTYQWGGFTQVAGTPKYLSFLGIGKGSGAGNTYKVVAIVKLTEGTQPLLCRYWYHAQGTDNKQSGVLKIVADDLETIYSTSGTPTQVKESPELKKAREEWAQLQKLSTADSTYKNKVESFADAYLAFLKFEASNGNSQLFLTQDQRDAAIALAKDPRYRKAIIDGLVGSFFQFKQVQGPEESRKDRLVRYLTHYREVIRAAVKIREFNVEALQQQSADKNWFTKWVPNLRQLAESFESERQGQTYEVGDGVFPRQPSRDEDRAYNILAEQLAQEKERLVAVSYLLTLVKDGTIQPEDLPRPDELDKINQKGLDRFNNRFLELKKAAAPSSQVARFFESRTGKQRVEKRSYGDVNELGSFLSYSAIIQKDVRTDPRMQAVLYAGLVTDATRKPVYEASYELKTIGKPSNDRDPTSPRVGGYLKGEVPQAFFKALDSSSIKRDGFFGAESWSRSVGEYLDLAMAVPLSNFLSGAGKLVSAAASKLAPKIGFLKLTGPAAATVAEAHAVFRGATVAPKAAVAGLEAGKSYVVEEVLEEGGKRVVRLAEGATTGSGKTVTLGIEEFEALARAGQVTLAKEGAAALTGLSRAGSQAVEKGAENLARTPSNLGRVMMTPLSEFKFFQNKVFTNAFSRAIGKAIQYITQTASRDLNPSISNMFKGLWGKFTTSGLGKRLGAVFKKGPTAANAEIQAHTAAGNALIAETTTGEKVLLEGARPGGTSRALFDEALAKSASGDAAAWKAYADGLKGKKIVVTSAPGTNLEYRQGIIVGAGSQPGTFVVEFEGFGVGKGTRTITVTGKQGGVVFEELLPVIPGTVAPTASEIADVLRTGRFQGQAISWNDFVNNFLKGQKVKITSQTFAGEIGEIVGPGTQPGSVKYRVTQASPDVADNLKDAAGRRVGQEIEINTDARLAASGRGSFDVVPPESPAASSAASGAATVARLEPPAFDDIIAALKSGNFEKFGVKNWAEFLDKYKGSRIKIVDPVNIVLDGEEGILLGSESLVGGSPVAGQYQLRYRVKTKGPKAPASRTTEQAQTINVDPGKYAGNGVGTRFQFIDTPVIVASSSSAESVFAAFVAGTSDVNALKALIGRQLKPTTGTLYSFGEVWEVVGVEGQKIRYRVIQSRAPTQTVGSEALLDANGIRFNGVELVAAPADDVVLTGRRIPQGVDPVKVAAAAAGGPAALAAAGVAAGDVVAVPASQVSAIRFLNTYKGSQLLILGFLHPDTEKKIPASVAFPPLKVTSTKTFSLEVGKACDGVLDGGSVGTVVPPATSSDDLYAMPLLTLDVGASCGSGRGTCSASDACQSSALPVSGTDSQRPWCKTGLVCCTKPIA